MSDAELIQQLQQKVFLLETRIRHLENELGLKNEEYETTARNYFEIITNMRKLTNELEEKSQELEIMLDSAPRMIFFNDNQQRFLRVNQAFTEVLNIPAEKVIGKTPSELFPENIARVLEDDVDLLHGGHHVIGKSVIIDTPGGRKHLLFDKIPYTDNQGKIAGTIGFAQDMTEKVEADHERKRLEQRIARAEKMEAIGMLAGGVAHDGNNILTGIIGYMELMLISLPEVDPNHEFLKKALASAQQMECLIADLLTLTRRAVGKKSVVNFNTIINDYFRSPTFFDLNKNHPGADFKLELDPDLLNIKGMKHNLIKVVMNLVTNAAEALRQAGTVQIRTANEHLDQPQHGYDQKIPDGDYITLEVIDDGTGMSPEVIDHLFEPFYTKKATGRSGTGLGMTVVYGIVQDHVGFIDLQSTEGEGTAFKLYFPITREAPVDAENEIPLDQLVGHGQTILVIDDAEAQREILSRFLDELGYHVVTVAGGEEAVAYMEHNTADLLVLDMIMDPGIDGLETYRRILDIHPHQKAIIASGYSATDRVRQALRLGAGQYLKKPYTLEKIGLAVQEELARDAQPTHVPVQAPSSQAG